MKKKMQMKENWDNIDIYSREIGRKDTWIKKGYRIAGSG